VGQGEACGRGAEHWTIVSCVEGLTCLDFVFEPDSALDPAVMPCSADSDCLAFYQPDWNPVCVGGDCVASLCAASCSEANGPDWCPEGFDPYYDHAREECLCVPVGAPGALPLGAACSLGPVNPGAGNCQAWGWCFSPILDAGPSCETDADCEALTPMPGVDCVGERCVFASCAAPCAVDCPAGWEDFQPTDYPCTCLARSQAEGEPCRFGEVNAEASDCQAGLDCIGMAPDPVNAPCPNGDADCIVFMDAQWNADCVDGGCGVSFCASPCEDGDCPCGSSAQAISGACYCIPTSAVYGSQEVGEPCSFDGVNDPGCPIDCSSGLTCLGQSADPLDMPCATQEDCRAYFPAEWNPDCVDGGCGASFCSSQCVDGRCDCDYEPMSLSGTCFCVPGSTGGIVEAGGACPFGGVNGSDDCRQSCTASLTCLGLASDPVNTPCAVDADCLAFLPESWNVDCVEGGCGSSFCSALCVSGQCQPGYGPYELSGDCYCLPAASDTPRSAGEACTYGTVNLLAGLCAEGLACAGVLSEEGAAPCPNGDADCLAFYDPGWNPDCVQGRCGASFCAVPCTGGACDAGLTPVDVGGDCYCRAVK